MIKLYILCKQFPTILDKIQRNQSHIKLSTLKSQSTIDYKGGLNLLKHVSLFSNGDFMPNPPNRLKSKRPSMNFNLKILTQQQQQEVKDQQKLNVEDVNLLQTTMDQRLIKNMQDSALLTARLERNKSQANIRKKQLLQIQPINTHRQSVQRVDEYGIQSMKVSQQGFMTQRNQSQQNIMRSREQLKIMMHQNQSQKNSKVTVLCIFNFNDIIELKRFYDIMDRESKGKIQFLKLLVNFKLMSNSQNNNLCIDYNNLSEPPTQAITNNSPDKFKQFTQNLMLAPSPTKLPGTQTVNTSNPLSPTLPQNQFHVQSQNQLKVIPKQNVKEFLRIFDIYNKDKSGQMSIQDLRKFLLDTYQRDDLVDGFLLRKNITSSPAFAKQIKRLSLNDIGEKKSNSTFKLQNINNTEQLLSHSIYTNSFNQKIQNDLDKYIDFMQNPGKNIQNSQQLQSMQFIDDEKSDFSDYVQEKVLEKESQKQIIQIEQFLSIIVENYFKSLLMNKIKKNYTKRIKLYQQKLIEDMKRKIREVNYQRNQQLTGQSQKEQPSKIQLLVKQFHKFINKGNKIKHYRTNSSMSFVIK